MPKKIYISSTFRDLELYRTKAQDALGFLKDYFDLVRIMEYMMPGSDQPPLTNCIADVNSCDIYILIIGKRYGSIALGTSLSFTEHEYNYAVSTGKTIIPLIAEATAEGLENTLVDNAAKFRAFVTMVTTKHQTFIKNFKTPDHMALQLTQALYPFSEKKWILTNEMILRCDRKIPFSSMYSTYTQKKNRLNVFSILCNEFDKPDSFMRRMANIEFGLKKECIVSPMKTAGIIAVSPDIEEQKMNFIRHIMPPAMLSFDLNIAESLEQLKQNGIGEIFLHFFLYPQDVADENTMTSIRLILTELEQACNEKNYSFYLTFIVQFKNSTPVERLDINKIRPNENLRIVSLSPITPIDDIELGNWLETYVTDSEIKINNIKNYFFAEKAEYNMSDFLAKVNEINSYLN